MVLHGVGAAALAEAPLRLVSLPHPRHGRPARYALAAGRAFEIQRLHRRPSSWLVGAAVEHDGSIYLATPVDPVFLALPFLRAAHAAGFSPLAQILASAEHPEAQALASCAGIVAGLDAVCDKKAGWDDSVFRVSDSKVTAWLRAKVAQAAKAIGAEAPEKALPLVSEYVSEAALATLADSFGVSAEEARGERASAAERAAAVAGGAVTADADTRSAPPGSKRKAASSSSSSSSSSSRAAKKVKNVDTSGMKGIRVFFKKKTK